MRRMRPDEAGNPLLVRQLLVALEQRGEEPTRLDARTIAAIGPPSVARFVAARLGRRSATVGTVARALAIVGDDASLAETAAVAAVDRAAAAGAVDELIDAELVHPRLPPRFLHPIIQQALLDSIPPAERTQLHLAAARELARDPARRERAAAHLLAAGPAGPVGERWAFDALTTAARRVGDRGSAEQAVRFLRRALEEEAPAPLRRSLLLELGAAESAARMPEAAERMEKALRLSSTPAERANASLGLSMVRFHAAELPQAVAACEDLLETAGDLDRELRLGLEFQAAATRMVGGLPSAETFTRMLALEHEVSRGETAAERSLLALIALVFAATTAHSAGEVAALADAAWGDGRLLAAVRSRAPHPGGSRDDDRAHGRLDRHRALGRLSGRSACGAPGSMKGGRGARCSSTPARSACARPGRSGRAIWAARRPTPSRRWRCFRPTIRSSARPPSPRSSTSTSSRAHSSRPWRSCATPGRPVSCRCR